LDVEVFDEIKAQICQPVLDQRFAVFDASSMDNLKGGGLQKKPDLINQNGGFGYD
jgi:hypothetical protein